MKWPLVEIRWIDSCGPHGWTRLSEQIEEKISEIVSVGFLVAETDRKKTIVASVDTAFGLDNPSVDGVTHIPCVAVLSLRVIEPADAV